MIFFNHARKIIITELFTILQCWYKRTMRKDKYWTFIQEPLSQCIDIVSWGLYCSYPYSIIPSPTIIAFINPIENNRFACREAHLLYSPCTVNNWGLCDYVVSSRYLLGNGTMPQDSHANIRNSYIKFHWCAFTSFFELTLKSWMG